MTAAAEDDFDRAFEIMVQQRAGALLVGTDPFFTSHLDRLLGLGGAPRNPSNLRCTRVPDWRAD